jgi:hypothetical protein
MLEDFDALAAKVKELTTMVHALRGGTSICARRSLPLLRARCDAGAVDEATRRLDALLDACPMSWHQRQRTGDGTPDRHDLDREYRLSCSMTRRMRCSTVAICRRQMQAIRDGRSWVPIASR